MIFYMYLRSCYVPLERRNTVLYNYTSSVFSLLCMVRVRIHLSFFSLSPEKKMDCRTRPPNKWMVNFARFFTQEYVNRRTITVQSRIHERHMLPIREPTVQHDTVFTIPIVYHRHDKYPSHFQSAITYDSASKHFITSSNDANVKARTIIELARCPVRLVKGFQKSTSLLYATLVTHFHTIRLG